MKAGCRLQGVRPAKPRGGRDLVHVGVSQDNERRDHLTDFLQLWSPLPPPPRGRECLVLHPDLRGGGKPGGALKPACAGFQEQSVSRNWAS